MPIVRMPNGDLVRFPDDMKESDIRAKIEAKFPEAGRSTMGNVGMGLLEGVSGDVIGAGQLAEAGVDYLRPGTSAAIKQEFPGVASAMHDVKEGSMRPTTSTAESLGRIGGGALPIALLAPELGGPGWLARLAQAAFEGGLAGGAQPTESGTAGSHLTGAAEGAAAAAGTRGAGRLMEGMAPLAGKFVQHAGALTAGEMLAKQWGIPHGWLLGFYLANTPLGQVVRRWATTGAKYGGKGVQAVAEPTGVGTAVGQLSGEEDTGRDVYVHARPKDDSQQ